MLIINIFVKREGKPSLIYEYIIGGTTDVNVHWCSYHRSGSLGYLVRLDQANCGNSGATTMTKLDAIVLVSFVAVWAYLVRSNRWAALLRKPPLEPPAEWGTLRPAPGSSHPWERRVGGVPVLPPADPRYISPWERRGQRPPARWEVDAGGTKIIFEGSVAPAPKPIKGTGFAAFLDMVRRGVMEIYDPRTGKRVDRPSLEAIRRAYDSWRKEVEEAKRKHGLKR